MHIRRGGPRRRAGRWMGQVRAMVQEHGSMKLSASSPTIDDILLTLCMGDLLFQYCARACSSCCNLAASAAFASSSLFITNLIFSSLCLLFSFSQIRSQALNLSNLFSSSHICACLLLPSSTIRASAGSSLRPPQGTKYSSKSSMETVSRRGSVGDVIWILCLRRRWRVLAVRRSSLA